MSVDIQQTQLTNNEVSFLVTGIVGTVSSYLWTFGDGGTSTAANPSYTYPHGGTHTVQVVLNGANLDGNQASLLILSTTVTIQSTYGLLRFDTPNLLAPVFEPLTYPPPRTYDLQDSKFYFSMDMQANKTIAFMSAEGHGNVGSWEAVLGVLPTGGAATILGGSIGGALPGFPWCMAKDGVHAYGAGIGSTGQITMSVPGMDPYTTGTTVFDYVVTLGLHVNPNVLATDFSTGHIISFVFRSDPLLNAGYFIDEIDPVAKTLVHSVQMWDAVTLTGFGGSNANVVGAPPKSLLIADAGIVYFTASDYPGGTFEPKDAIWVVTMATGAGASHYAYRSGDDLPIVGMDIGGTQFAIPAIAKPATIRSIPNVVPIRLDKQTVIATGGAGAFTLQPTTLTVTPTTARVGDTGILLTGTGFTPGDTISVTDDSSALTTAPGSPVVGLDGTWTAIFTVPSPTGYQTLIATDLHSLSAYAVLFVVQGPTLTVTPTTAHLGVQAVLNGHGFTPGDTISVTDQGNPLTTVPGPPVVGIDGSWVATFVVPPPTGTDTLVATDLHSMSASAILTVLPATLTVSPNMVQVGDTGILLTGTGFTPGDPITVTDAGNPLLTVPGSPGTGDWTTTFTAPLPYGTDVLIATDAHGVTAFTNLYVSLPDMNFGWIKAFYNSMYGVALLRSNQLQLYKVIPQGAGYTWEFIEGTQIPFTVSRLGTGGTNAPFPYSISATDMIVMEQTAGSYNTGDTTFCMRVIHLSGETISLSGAQHSVNTLGSLEVLPLRSGEGEFLFCYPGFQDDTGYAPTYARYGVYEGMTVSGGVVSLVSQSVIGPPGGSHTTINIPVGLNNTFSGAGFCFASHAYGGVVISLNTDTQGARVFTRADWTVSGGVTAVYYAYPQGSYTSPQIFGGKDGVAEVFSSDFGGPDNIVTFSMAPGGSVSYNTSYTSAQFPDGYVGLGGFWGNGAFTNALSGYPYVGTLDNNFSLSYELTDQSGTTLTPSGHSTVVRDGTMTPGFGHSLCAAPLHANNIVAVVGYVSNFVSPIFYFPFAFQAV